MSSLRALAGSGVGGLFHCEGLSLSCLIITGVDFKRIRG